MKKLTVLLLFIFISIPSWAQENRLFSYITQESDIREGGCGVFELKDETFLVAVASVTVGNKKETACKTAASAKAKRDLIAFVNGSEITSYTELVISEDIAESLAGSKITADRHYEEVIKEKIIGNVNEIKSLGGWFSEDRTVYYFAIYKTIE